MSKLEFLCSSDFEKFCATKVLWVCYGWKDPRQSVGTMYCRVSL
jgi:hypothetical protein